MEKGSANQYYRDELSQKFDLVDVSAFERIGEKYSDIRITYFTTPMSEKFTIYFPERKGWAIERRVIYEYIYEPTFPEKGHWLINHQRNTGTRENFGKLSYSDDINKVLKHFKQTASAARSLKRTIDKEQMNERKLTKAELDKREDIIKDMKGNKRSLVKRYGKDAEKVMYGRATNMAKKKTDENMDQKAKIREMVKTALSTPQTTTEEFTDKHDENPALKGGQKDLPDALQKSIIDKSVKEEEETVTEDIDLGHEDNEPGMLKSDLYRIGKYAMELYQIMDKLDDGQEVDLPHWWQAKVIKAKDALVSAKHFLDFELKEPQIDQVTDMVDAKGQKYAIDEDLNETTYSGFIRNPEDPDSVPFEPKDSVLQFQEDLRALFGKFKGELNNPEFIKGVAEIMVSWKSLLRSQLGEAIEGKPSQDEVDKFFSDTQNEIHYLASKPVMGQKGDRVRSEIEPWDEYDLSNWNALVKKAKVAGKIAEMIKGAHSVMGDKSKKKKRPSKKDIKLAKDTQADYEKSKEEEEDYEGLAARSGASLEEDMNDPVLVKARAAKMADEKEKAKQSSLDKKYGSSFMDKLDAEIDLKNELSDLKDERKQLMIDMEQEAEPEGGEIADDYGSRLNDIEAKIDIITAELDDLRMYESLNEVTPPPPFNTVSKKRAKADMKQFLKGKRADGMGKYDAIILGIDGEGNQTQLKSLKDIDNSKYVEYALADEDYKIPSIKEAKKSTTSTIAEKLAKQLKEAKKYTNKNNIVKKSSSKNSYAVIDNDGKELESRLTLDDAKEILKDLNKESLDEAKTPKTKEELEAAIADAERKIEKHSESLAKIDSAPGGGNWSSSSAEGKKERKLKDAQGKLRDKIDTYTKKLNNLK